MRSFLLALPLILPLLAIAAGAEDTEYIGSRPNNGLLRLKFAADPAPWTQGNFIYGTDDGPGLFKYCWPESRRSVSAAAQAEVPVAFSCTREQGGKAAVVYRPVELSADARKLFADLARRAALGTGKQRGDGTLTRTYQCKQGCLPEAPQFIFEVTHFD